MPSLNRLRHPTIVDLLKIVLLGAIWVSAFLAIKLSVHEAGPLWLVMIRVAVAFLPIALFAWWRKDPLPPTIHDGIVIIAALACVFGGFLVSRRKPSTATSAGNARQRNPRRPAPRKG